MSDHEKTALANDVQAIIHLAQEYDLDALTVVDGDFELSLTRREPPAAPVTAAAVAAPSTETVTAPTPSATTPVGAAASAGNVVTAPIIGVFYRASSPNSQPFVDAGARVSVGQTLCILEAMKLMNEITSDYNGVVTAIHAENGDLVTIGQPLFTVAP